MDHSYPSPPKTYPLPASDIPAEIRESLHPWIAGFIGLTPEEATERLHDRWASIQRPSLVALRDVLATFEVRAIVESESGGMIYAVRPDSDESIGNCFYLPAPMDPDDLDSRLESVGLSKNTAVREFLTHFAGLAEDTTTAGDFVYHDAPWPTFVDSWDGSIEDFDEWKGSLMIYFARNGCHVLVRQDGKVAWWVVQEHLVGEQAKDFDEFVVQFSEHRKLAWPFDPYGPPEDAR